MQGGTTWGFSSVRAAQAEDMDRIQIERLGGLGGFGLPGSHLKSKGDVSASDLSAADRKRLDDLFGSKAPASQTSPDAVHAFRYRITRQTPSGQKTVEVPEDLVPESLRDSVKDTLE